MRTSRIPVITKITNQCLAVILVFALLPCIAIAGATDSLDEQLIKAAAFEDLALVRLLLDKGSEVNAKDKDGKTPLMAAVGQGNLQVVPLLLDKGADVNARDKDAQTALMHLCQPLTMVKSKSVTRIHDKPTVFHKAELKYGSRVLLAEDQDRYKNMAELLLGKGAEVNAKDKHGRTALMRALQPLTEVKGDSLTLFDRTEGDVVEFTLKVKNGTVLVKREPPNEIVELLKAHGAKE